MTNEVAGEEDEGLLDNLCGKQLRSQEEIAYDDNETIGDEPDSC